MDATRNKRFDPWVIVAAGWWAAALPFTLGFVWLRDVPLFVLGYWGAILSAVPASFIALISAFPEGRWLRASVAAGTALGALALLLEGPSLSQQIYFRAQRATYERFIAELKLPKEQRTVAPGLPAFVELGPPVRVAFMWPGRARTNWCGAVYDPGDSLESGQRGFPPFRTRGCRRYERGWAHCCFGL